MRVTTLLVVGALGLFTMPVAAQSQAPHMTEWSAETRLIVSFHANDAAVQKLLPAGWVVDPSTGAANRGANINVTVMERLVVLDPDGKPLKTGASRYVVVGIPAKNPETGQANTVIVTGISPEGAGAYGVYETATVSRVERTSSGNGEENGRSREAWEFASAGGDRVAITVAYRRGPATRAKVEAHVRSGKNPEFTRTYRIEQATDLLKSALTGVNRVDEWQFRAAGPHLASVFDGSETLLSITAVPSYVREISLP